MADITTLRRLVSGDEAMTDRFLEPHTTSSMFLRANMRAAGLSWDGQALQGYYVGAFAGDRLTGVIAHYWNGNLMVQAPDHAADLAISVLQTSDVPFKGLLGPQRQVDAITARLAITDDLARVRDRELLFELPLNALLQPDILTDGTVQCRRATLADTDHIVEWRIAYSLETLNEPDTPQNRADAHKSVPRYIGQGRLFILEAEGQIVAMSSFNAVLDDLVQVGGVYTPPNLRGRGYGRAIVAGSLAMAAANGASKAILFTDDVNVPAQRAYASLGFTRIGEFGLTMFHDDIRSRISL